MLPTWMKWLGDFAQCLALHGTSDNSDEERHCVLAELIAESKEV
ncbi:hypothetical protein [Burkholderia singularis]|nr:hypothetical protein [Burkholderia singularis]